MNDTIAAIATPPGKGAIAIVRVSGSDAAALAQRLARTRRPLRPRVATHARIVDETGALLDRGLAIFFPAPHSYTGEDCLELQIHGSPAIARETVRALLACGARLAQPGEFTRRAFLAGKLDLRAAQAVADAIDAQTRAAARAAAANFDGALTLRVRGLRATLGEALERLAAAIDFPDEVEEPDRATLCGTLRALATELDALRRDAEIGRLVREGLTVAIVGPPNAGKSSLLNALLGEERAIVSHVAGTTRDTIEETIAIGGVPVRLIDTAGIREHADRLEGLGIERTRRAIEEARIALVVIDGSVPPAAEARATLDLVGQRSRVVLLNKADLGDAGVRALAIPGAIAGSVRDGRTLTELRAAIAAAGWGGETPDLQRPHLASLPELDAVNEALGALRRALVTLEEGSPVDFAAVELHSAFSSLGHVSEHVAGEEMLDRIFSRFCIGK